MSKWSPHTCKVLPSCTDCAALDSYLRELVPQLAAAKKCQFGKRPANTVTRPWPRRCRPRHQWVINHSPGGRSLCCEVQVYMSLRVFIRRARAYAKVDYSRTRKVKNPMLHDSEGLASLQREMNLSVSALAARTVSNTNFFFQL
ncbi:unnamed protein product, partial [Trichogramma brassicae]